MRRAAILLALAGCGAPERREAAPPPNILLIVSDDHGHAGLGCFGGQEILTPNLDRLAAEGVRLTSFYVTWPACTPSRGSILTGRYPQRNGLYDMIRNNEVNFGHRFTEEEYAVSPEMTLGLDLREVTIAQVLKGAGYATGMVGKWDSGRARRFLPLQRGFDFFYGFANTGIDYWTHERYGIPSMFRGNDRVKDEGYATDLFERESIRFIRGSRGRPWFLYLAFNAPHGASNLEKGGVQATDEYLAKYPGRDPKGAATRYMAAVTHMDHSIGRILREVGENTLVVFHSDNGGAGQGQNGPLRGGKSQMFEGGIRVPCIAWWPSKLPAGRVCDEFLTSLEWFRTFAFAAGARLPESLVLDGFSALSILASGESWARREEMFWQRRGDKAARIGTWKWVETARGGGLFDLSTDLGEKNDLSAERPEVLAHVKSRWEAWRREMDAAEPRGPFRDY